MVTGASDINTDPVFSKATGPDTALCCSYDPDVTMALVAAQATQICIALTAS